MMSHAFSSPPRVSSLWAECNTASLLALKKKNSAKRNDYLVIHIVLMQWISEINRTDGHETVRLAVIFFFYYLQLCFQLLIKSSLIYIMSENREE